MKNLKELAQFAVKGELTVEKANEAITKVCRFVQGQPVNNWVDYKIKEHKLKEALPIELLCDTYHLEYFNTSADTMITHITLVYDTYGGQVGIWSEKFGCTENETYLEIQMDMEEEGWGDAVIAKFIEISQNS